MKRLTALLAAVLLTLSVAGCGGSEASSASSAPAQSSSQASSEAAATEGSSSEAAAAEKLVVAASPSPHAEILESVKEQLAAKGIELEIKEFTDYVLPNNAVDSGEVDANYFQHQPYLTDFNAKNGTDLVSAGSIHFEPLGIYAGKTASLEELPDGAVIGVPNDPTNEGILPYLDYAFFSYEKLDDQIRDFLKRTQAKTGRTVIAMLGEDGSLAYDGTDWHREVADRVEVVNTVGAGDSYVAGFAKGLCEGKSLDECMHLGKTTATQIIQMFDPY